MTRAKQYRKKPVVIEAMKLTPNEPRAIWEWMGESYKSHGESEGQTTDLQIKTLECVMTANVGDYIIKGIKGEFYPCKPDIFEATYEEVEP